MELQTQQLLDSLLNTWDRETETLNSLSVFSDNTNIGSQIEAITVLQDGSVGIGTTNPTTKLAVDGTISGVSGLYSQGLFISGVPVSTGSAAEADTLATVTARGNTTSTSILSTGPHISGVTGLFSDKIGIGTDSPSYGLHLKTNADIFFEGNVAQNDYLFDGGGENLNVFRDPDNTNRLYLTFDKDDELYVGRQGSVDFIVNGTNQLNTLIQTDASENDVFFPDGKYGFGFEGVEPSALVHVSGNSFFDGDVGIGTSTPDDALTIVGTSADFSIRKADNSLAARLVQFSAGGAQLRLYDSGSNEQIRLAGDGGGSFITGNVGIGLTNPNKPLQVAGGISGEDIVLDAGNSSDMAIQFAGSSNGIYCDPVTQMRFAVDSASSAMVLSSNNIQFGAGGNSKLTWSTNNYLEFNGGGTKARLNSVGLGVGTTDPLTTLDVRGDISGSGSFLGTGVGNRITNNGVPYLLSGDSPAENDTLQDVTTRGNTTSTSILSTGPHISGVTGLFSDKVGIGTDSPTYELDVNGNIGVNEYIYHNDNDTTFLRFGPSTNRAILVAGNTSIFDTNNEDFLVGTDAFFVDIGNDRVGVANTNPQQALDVSGSGVFSEKVGIGTNNPSHELSVAGDVFLEGDNKQIFFGGTNTFVGESSNSQRLKLRGGGSNSSHTISIDSQGRMAFGAVTATERITITDGNIELVNSNTGVDLGTLNNADGKQSVALGYDNDALENQSVAVGYSNQSTGVQSATFGNGNKAAVEGTAIGVRQSCYSV